MPNFITISPTSIRKKKEEAWGRFRDGRYIAIGWLNDFDLTSKTIDEVIALLRPQQYPDEADAITSFTRLWSLGRGDYVAVNNTNDGLFGVGIIDSGYKFQFQKHDTGDDEGELFYPHYMDVKWIHTEYRRRSFLIADGETSWKPYGTIANFYTELPPYITRLLGMPPPAEASETQADPDEEFFEGREQLRLHRKKERNPRAAKRKKELVLVATGELLCEVCDFDFADFYGPIGSGFAECHHRIPVSTLTEEYRLHLSDLAIVCANCHRMLHRRPGRGVELYTVEELRGIVQARRTQ